MAKVLGAWRSLRASLWFVPGLLVTLAVVLAVGLIEVEALLDDRVFAQWPRLFGAGAAGSRGLLVAVATSMVTVAGVVFSITLVALSLTSSQYTSRVLRNFMADRTNQAVLGVFVGIFAYCLVVLRTIREGPEIEFIPSVAVLGGVVLAFIGIGYFIYFIHHVAITIQASHILARIAAETVERIDHLFPQDVGEEDDAPGRDPSHHDPNARWTSAPALRTGYIQAVDSETLMAIAREEKCVVRMECRIGDFVIAGMPLASICARGGSEPARREAGARLSAAYAINHQRTTDQDAAYGVRQILDVALKALSPGINDTTTAVMSLDYLTAILVKLCGRRIESPWRYEQGALRVMTRAASFADFVTLAFDQIRQNAGGNVAVLARIVAALETLEGETKNPLRRRVLLDQARAVAEVIRRTIPSPQDRAEIEPRVERCESRLSGGPRASASA